MAYSKSFKNELPYYRWYDNLCGTRKHIKERCDEIERKYIEKQQANDADREKEYMKSEELGMIFDQHGDISLDIIRDRNQELISLISEMKSCVEKILREILREYQFEEPKGSFISSSIEILEQKKEINMSFLNQEKLSINLLNKERNDYEHELDSLLYDKTVEHILKCVDDCCLFMENFIQKIYESDYKS